jgi:hypothetical protein
MEVVCRGRRYSDKTTKILKYCFEFAEKDCDHVSQMRLSVVAWSRRICIMHSRVREGRCNTQNFRGHSKFRCVTEIASWYFGSTIYAGDSA